jgi:hypothetical protein
MRYGGVEIKTHAFLTLALDNSTLPETGLRFLAQPVAWSLRRPHYPGSSGSASWLLLLWAACVITGRAMSVTSLKEGWVMKEGYYKTSVLISMLFTPTENPD